jgi:hypothetical protein
MPKSSQLFLVFIRPLNQLGLSYMVTGSAASMAYGIPRMTLDIDVVLELTTGDAERLPAIFPASEFYCPPSDAISVEAERPARGHFNVIHMATGFKADLYPAGDDPLHCWAMARRRRVEMFGESVMLAPPEYVIVRKLEYFKEGGSEKHLRDIRGMFDVSGEAIDRTEVERMVEERGLQDAWDPLWKRPPD